MNKITIIIALVLGAVISTSQACENTCWRNLNKATLDRLIKRNPVKASRLRPIIDAICEQGRPITKQEKRLAKRLHLKKCGETPAPTPKPKPTPTPRPSATPTPRPTPTPTPRPTPTPSATPPPSPTPTPTPAIGCLGNCCFWIERPELWCPEADSIKLGNVTYTKAQILVIFGEENSPTNGIIRLAKWVINTKLNLICHNTNPDCIIQTVKDADYLIGNKVVPPYGTGFIPASQTENIINIFQAYNGGRMCAGPLCEDNPPFPCVTPTPTP